MRTKRSFRQTPAPRLKQKQVLVYAAVGIALAVLAGIGVFLYLNLGDSEDSSAAGVNDYSVKSGFWTDGPTWNRGVAPPTNDLTADIEIFRYVTQAGDLTYGDGGGANGHTLTVTDTLVILGNLNMGNKSNIVVRDGGVLVITGDFTAANKISVGNGGIIALGGSMYFPTNNQDTYDGSNGDLFVVGTVNGNTAASADRQSGDALKSAYPEIFSLVNGETTTLPIELAYFKAVRQGDQVTLEWVTDAETNNDFFTIERSADRKRFEGIATIPGAGNSTTPLRYRHVDASPLTGITYYRLKQTDYDGKFSYSDIQAVNSQLQNHFGSVPVIRSTAPNPFTDQLVIAYDLPADGPVELRLINLQGTLVATAMTDGFQGQNQYTYHGPQALVSGTYLLSITQHSVVSKVVRVIRQ